MPPDSKSSSSRRLRRLYSDRDLSALKEIWLSPEESRHALKSLRLEVGDVCFLVDGSGCEAESRLERVKDELAFFKILTLRQESRGFSIPVAILPALIKKGKMDSLVEKAQEFGVSLLQPVICERSEFEISKERFQSVLARWKKIAKEAAKQSGALKILAIQEPIKFEKALEEIDSQALVLVFHTHESAQDWTEAAQEIVEKKEGFSKIVVMIGPEGGFSAKEIQSAVALNHSNLKVVRMVSTVLKADTAFVAALAGIPFFIRKAGE